MSSLLLWDHGRRHQDSGKVQVCRQESIGWPQITQGTPGTHHFAGAVGEGPANADRDPHAQHLVGVGLVGVVRVEEACVEGAGFDSHQLVEELVDLLGEPGRLQLPKATLTICFPTRTFR